MVDHGFAHTLNDSHASHARRQEPAHPSETQQATMVLKPTNVSHFKPNLSRNKYFVFA